MAKKTPASPGISLTDADDVLRSHGLRRTLARVGVLRFMHEHPRPMSHGEVARALEPEGFDNATVYRNLTDLAEAGILARTDLGDHTWRFELKAVGGETAANHAHFICTDCGGVTCLPAGAVELVRKRRTPRAISRRDVVIHVRGVCDDCA